MTAFLTDVVGVKVAFMLAYLLFATAVVALAIQLGGTREAPRREVARAADRWAPAAVPRATTAALAAPAQE